MAFECRLLGVVRLSIFGRFVFLESAISIRFVWDFSEIWICGLYFLYMANAPQRKGLKVIHFSPMARCAIGEKLKNNSPEERG